MTFTNEIAKAMKESENFDDFMTSWNDDTLTTYFVEHTGEYPNDRAELTEFYQEFYNDIIK